jgi:hypothetical protein
VVLSIVRASITLTDAHFERNYMDGGNAQYAWDYWQRAGAGTGICPNFLSNGGYVINSEFDISIAPTTYPQASITHDLYVVHGNWQYNLITCNDRSLIVDNGTGSDTPINRIIAKNDSGQPIRRDYLADTSVSYPTFLNWKGKNLANLSNSRLVQGDIAVHESGTTLKMAYRHSDLSWRCSNLSEGLTTPQSVLNVLAPPYSITVLASGTGTLASGILTVSGGSPDWLTNQWVPSGNDTIVVRINSIDYTPTASNANTITLASPPANGSYSFQVIGPSIQAAIDAALDGDIVYLPEGNFNVYYPIDFRDKTNISIIGDGGDGGYPAASGTVIQPWFYDVSGTGTGVVNQTAKTLTVAGKNWATNRWVGYTVEINSSDYTVVSNTGTVITLASAPPTAPTVGQ